MVFLILVREKIWIENNYMENNWKNETMQWCCFDPRFLCIFLVAKLLLLLTHIKIGRGTSSLKLKILCSGIASSLCHKTQKECSRQC